MEFTSWHRQPGHDDEFPTALTSAGCCTEDWHYDAQLALKQISACELELNSKAAGWNDLLWQRHVSDDARW